MKIQTIDKNIYENYIKQYKYRNFLQSTMEGNKMSNEGWEVEYIAAYDKDTIVAAALVSYLPLLKVYKYAYIPRGMFIDYENVQLLKEFTKELKKYLNSKKAIYLEIDPYIPLKQRDKDGNIVEDGFDHSNIIDHLTNAGFTHLENKVGYDPDKQCRFMSGIDLKDKTKDEIFKNFSYMTRQDVRTSKKFCVEVRNLNYDELNILDDMEQETSERQGFHATPLSFYQSLYKYFGDSVVTKYAYMDVDTYYNTIISEKTKLEKSMADTKAFLENNPNSSKKQKKLKTDEEYYNSLCKKEKNITPLKEKYGKEIPLACCLFINYGRECLYLVGASNYECRNFKGPYAAQWAMMQEAIDTGYEYYNFYGISGYYEQGQEGYGVFDYKRGFNAEVVELIGNFILEIKPSLYKLHTKMHG